MRILPVAILSARHRLPRLLGGFSPFLPLLRSSAAASLRRSFVFLFANFTAPRIRDPLRYGFRRSVWRRTIAV
jgi:hypothetical protein